MRGRVVRGTVGAMLAASFPALLPARAAAQSASGQREVRLEYRPATAVAGACPDEETFRHMVGIFTRGQDPFSATAAETVRVSLDASGSAYRATIAVIGPDGAPRGAPEEHTLRTCPEAAREAASSVYVLVAPSGTQPPAAEPPSTEAPATEPRAAGPPAKPARTTWRELRNCGTREPAAPCPVVPPPPPPMDLTVGLGTYVMMTSYLTANVAPAVGLFGEVAGEVISVRLELRVALPSRIDANVPIDPTKATAPQEFDLSQFTALLVPCARYKYFVGCGVLQGGFFYAKNPWNDEIGQSIGLGPRLGFEVPFAERFAVFGFGEVLFAPLLYGLDVTRAVDEGDPSPNVQWTQPVASAFFGVGLSVKFK